MHDFVQLSSVKHLESIMSSVSHTAKKARLDDLQIIVKSKEHDILDLTAKLQAAEAQAKAAAVRENEFELKLKTQEQQLQELQNLTKELLRRQEYSTKTGSKSFLDPLLYIQLKLLREKLEANSYDQATIFSESSTSNKDK